MGEDFLRKVKYLAPLLTPLPANIYAGRGIFLLARTFQDLTTQFVAVEPAKRERQSITLTLYNKLFKSVRRLSWVKQLPRK